MSYQSSLPIARYVLRTVLRGACRRLAVEQPLHSSWLITITDWSAPRQVWTLVSLRAGLTQRQFLNRKQEKEICLLVLFELGL